MEKICFCIGISGEGVEKVYCFDDSQGLPARPSKVRLEER
jgi:hypothetical protein